MFKSIFRTALTDVDTSAKEELGCLRVENDSKYGERWFRYCQNRTGGSLAADSLVSYDGAIAGAVTTNGGTTTTATRAAGSFITDGVRIDDIIYQETDAGGAGAAPEGEYSFITDVNALSVTFSPALTAAIANADTVNFINRFRILAAAAGDGVAVAGIPMAAIADGSFGWIQVRGLYPSANVVAAGTAIAERGRLTAGAAILTPTTGAAADFPVATCLQVVASGTVRRKAVVLLTCL